MKEKKLEGGGMSGGGRKAARIVGTLLGSFLLAGIGAYMGMSYYYSNKFFPGTMINSFDCGDLTAAQCEELIREKVEDYSLTISARDQEPQTLTAEDIGYSYKSDGAVEKALEDQNPLEWIRGYFVKENYSAGEDVVYDKKKVKACFEKLKCMKPENQVQPQDAYIEFQDTLFAIVPGEEGCAVDEDKALKVIYKSIENTEESVNLDKEGAYLEPSVRAEDRALLDRLQIVNTYAKASITHTFGDETEELTGVTIKDWFSRDANGALYLDGEVLKQKLWEYVAGLAERHDTLGMTRTFTATSGRTVKIKGGNYGWQINQYDEVEQMYQEILNGEQVVREPSYSSYGETLSGSSDIGDTYIEVDIAEQHMYYYKDGAVILESDFVSGDMSKKGRKTDQGVFHMAYKTKDYVLRGEKKPNGKYEYESPVKYWMPFNGGEGFHDASWRDEFGGEIYKTNGSHGCVNLPSSVAAQLYDIIDESVPIVVFY